MFGTRLRWEGTRTTLECIFELFSFLPATGAILEWYKWKADATERERRVVLLGRRGLENRVADTRPVDPGALMISQRN